VRVMQNNSPNPNNHLELEPKADDTIQTLSWSPKANFLVAGSWDSKLRCWEITDSGCAPKLLVDYGSPVLTSCWHDDGANVFVGGCDNKAQVWDLNRNALQPIASHEQPVKYVHWLSQHNILMTGSWDKTVRYWDLRNNKPALSIPLPERVYSADVRENLAIVTTADKNVFVYNLNNPSTPYTSIMPPFKYQNRCVRIFPTLSGFAVGSIEGRVAIRYIDKADQTKGDFAFKCHRTARNQVYAVNDIAFHPLGTFATCGSDGTFHFWDKDSKQRLKQFKKCSLPISCCSFNAEGTIFAYAVCYDWHMGISGYNPNIMKNHILLHNVGDEIKPKPRVGGSTSNRS